MEIIQLIFRVLIFSAGFYFLLEYIVACEVSTWVGVGIMVLCVSIIVVLFIIMGMNNMVLCGECNRPRFPTPVERLQGVAKSNFPKIYSSLPEPIKKLK